MRNNRRKKKLAAALVLLILIFLAAGAGELFLISYKKNEIKEQQKQEAMKALDDIPELTPTPAATATPVPTATPTPSPTPVPTILPAFDPDDYWDYWYSTSGLVSVNVYNVSLKSISFTYAQASDRDGTHVSEADVTAEVAGNAAQFEFTDSFGSTAFGEIIFDNGQFYMKVETTARAEGASVSPKVNCIMVREKPEIQATATPVPDEETEVTPVPVEEAESGDYIFPDSDKTYLTDDQLSAYSSDQLELAKNEIYARHGRQFVTESIADYFNSKSWYNGTIDPETFDAQQNSIFNDYELANIYRISEWEQKKAEEGQ